MMCEKSSEGTLRDSRVQKPSLMQTQLELLETQLRDEEATQSRKAVRFHFAAEAGGADASMAAAGQTFGKWPCFFAARRNTASGFSSSTMMAEL